MGDVLAVIRSCCIRPLPGGGGEWKHKAVATIWQCRMPKARQKLKPMIVKGSMVNPSTYTSRVSTDLPLYEVSWASFDQYLEDKPRVFKAVCPDKQRSQQLNEEEWRIHMLPIDFLFLTTMPIVDIRLRCKSQGIDYPPEVPLDITRVIEINIIRWKLDGLDDILKPSHFSLGVNGVLYSVRRGPRSRLIFRLQMSTSFILPAMLSLVPEGVCQQVAQNIQKRLVDNMKNKVNSSLLADYDKFKRERSIELV